MYYFTYENIDYDSFTYRPYSLYSKSDFIIDCTVNVNANAIIREIKMGSCNVDCKSNLAIGNTFTRIYSNCQFTVNNSFDVSRTILKDYSCFDIKSNADMVTNEVIRDFEQTKMTSGATFITDSVFREKSSFELLVNFDMEVNSIMKVYANVILTIDAELDVNAKETIYSGLADADTYFFNFGGRCYFYNGLGYYYYDGEKVGKVTDIAYVPTITMGRTPTGGGSSFEDLNYLSNSWIDSFSGTEEDTEYKLSFEGLSNKPVKVWINGELKEEGELSDFTVDRLNGKVIFQVAPGEGTDNIKIQAEKEGLMNHDYILKCTQMVIYGGKNDNRIFACRGNTRYHSEINDPTYWPENNYVAVTSDAENLVGFGKMYDYLINLKENSLTFSIIENDVNGDIIFPVYPLNDEYGCLAPASIQPVANGLIFLAQTKTGAPVGVAYLSPTTVRNQLNVRIISEDINKSVHVGVTGLTEYSSMELMKAKSYVYDNKYWLRTGDRVWILDLVESDFSMGKYCWYPYDGPISKANCFMEHEGNFYVGDDANGTIYRENKGLNDGQKPINAYWTSPIIYCGSRSWTKDFEELHIIFGPQVQANHRLIFITDEDREVINLEIESARIFSYTDLNYESFHYGTNPYPSKQTELVGYSAEYLQWVIENNELNQGLTILAQELDYLWGERS